MSQRANPPQRHPAAPVTARGTNNQGVVVTTHHDATQAGVAVLNAGGNAVDAAIAANAVVGVVRPDTCGIGGDLFALIHTPGQETPVALNASGTAGSGATAAALRSTGVTSVPLRSPWSVTIPGCVDGWAALAAKYGTMTLADVLEPAITFARDGFEVSTELADSLVRIETLLAGQAAAVPLYPNGPAGSGTVVQRPRLAESLGTFAMQGRDAFYLDVLAAGLGEVSSGRITLEDLEASQAMWIEPIGLDLYGWKGWTIPPNSQGYLTLATAWVADRFSDVTDPTDPAYHHAMIEAYRAVASERDDVVGDPAHAPLPNSEILNPARLSGFVDMLDADRTGVFPTPQPAPGGTTYLCALDGNGMGVSLIQSNFHGIGSGLGAGDTGIFLHNRGAGFNLIDGHHNEMQPGRRPLHTLSPTLWTEGDRLRLLLGTRGGQYQPQLLLQVMARLKKAGLALPDAVAGPRWVVDGLEPGTSDPMMQTEGDLDGTVDALRALGHRIDEVSGWQRGWGPIAAIQVEDEGRIGAGDPRVSTSSVGIGVPAEPQI